MQQIAHLAAEFYTLFGSRLRHLVPDGIHHHARMIEVLFHHCAEVILVSLKEIARIVVIIFGDIPAVEALVHDVHAELVARIEERPRGGVVRNAQSVEALFFEDAHTALFGIGIAARTQNAVVVVDAPAAKERPLPVDEKAAHGVALHRADAERRFEFLSPAPCNGGIEVRRFRRPEFGIGDRKFPRAALGDKRFAVINFHFRPLIRRHRNDGGRDRARHDPQGFGGVLGGDNEPHGAVDARARIPAAVGDEGIIGGDFEEVFPRPHNPVQRDGKFRIAVLVRTDFDAVYKHFGIAVDAFKEERNILFQLLRREGELSLIAVLPAREERPRFSAQSGRRAPLYEHRIMRKGDGGKHLPLFAEFPATV